MLKDLTGCCAYCGQTKIVKAEDQEEANQLATIDCTCPGGELERKKKHVQEQLDELIGELAPDNGWDPVRPKVLEAITNIAYHIAEDSISSCALRVDDTNLKITRNKGKINIERSKTIREGGSIEK